MVTEHAANANILIVDDEPLNVRLLERMLAQAGYTRLQSTTDPRLVLALCQELQPDLVLLDLHMPFVDGFTLLEQLSQRYQGKYLPILVLTADITVEAKARALSNGAKDFLTKPLERTEVLLRIHNLLETRRFYLELHRQNQTLEDKVRERTHDLLLAQNETLARLALAAEYRDDQTGQHTRRVGHLSALVGMRLGLSEKEVATLWRAAPLHDVGKIAIPDAILRKPGRLSAEEYQVMKSHTTLGAGMLAGGQTELLQVAEQIALTHHERWDGTGYPHHLAGESIPLVGRIVAVVDVFDALTHERPYKAAWPATLALAELQQQSGTQFDPRVVAAFLQINPQHINQEVADVVEA